MLCHEEFMGNCYEKVRAPILKRCSKQQVLQETDEIDEANVEIGNFLKTSLKTVNLQAG